jgi:hypothetical protein
VRAFWRGLARLFGLWVMVAAAPAHAHPKIDEARARIEAAEFEAALRLLAEAEADTGLTRQDAASLLELRALVHLALRDKPRAEQTLRQLAVFAPDHTFAASTTPDLIAAFEKVRAGAPPPPQVTLESVSRPDGVRLSARVSGDDLGLTRGVRLWTRIGDGPWRSTLADETVIAAAAGTTLQCRAVAESIGGAPLAESSVQSIIVTQQAAGSGDHVWLYAGVIGGVVAVAGTVLAVALLNRDSSSTRPSPPELVGR